MGVGDRALTVQDDPHRPEVHTGVVVPLTHHFRGHVKRGATEHTLLIPRGHVLCEAEVYRQEARQQSSNSSCFCSWLLKPHTEHQHRAPPPSRLARIDPPTRSLLIIN